MEEIPIAKLSDFLNVTCSMERSYQVKHKIDKVGGSQVDSQNNKYAVKKQIPNSVKKKVNKERTEKTLSGEKRVFIVGDSVIKDVNGEDISGKLENCKVYVRPCHGTTIRCLKDPVKLVLQENPGEISFHIRTNDLPS